MGMEKGKGKRKGGGRVLIVDDDPLVRGVLSDIFYNVGGYKTDVAADGFDGIEKIKNNEYDIVFADMAMPRLNGMDFLREIKKINPSMPVVITTGIPSIDMAVNAIKEGAQDFITKPFRIDTVISIADRITGEKKLLNKLAVKDDYEASVGELKAELFKKLQEIGILQSISTELDGLCDNKEIFERIVAMASKLFMVKEASFGAIENGHLKIKGSIGTMVKDISIANSIFENVIKKKTFCLASLGEVNPHNGTLLTSPFLSVPLTMNNEVFGILNLSNKADGTAFTDDEIRFALTFAEKAAMRIENNALYEVFYTNLMNTLKSLVISIEARDPYTKHHSERVSLYSLQIADVINLGAEDKDAIKFGGYLHDIGKIGVRDTVLVKPGMLTPEETTEIRLHPVIGYNILEPLRFFPNEMDIIRHHHERFDGSGYPDGLACDKIPLIARIAAVADTYDAMTSSRPYRNAMCHDAAIKELKRCSSSQLEDEIVLAFLQTPAGKGGARLSLERTTH